MFTPLISIPLTLVHASHIPTLPPSLISPSVTLPQENPFQRANRQRDERQTTPEQTTPPSEQTTPPSEQITPPTGQTNILSPHLNNNYTDVMEDYAQNNYGGGSCIGVLWYVGRRVW